jgi:hypothetical protein
MLSPPPPFTAATDLDAQLASTGWAVLEAHTLARLADVPLPDWQAWLPHWQALPADPHLRDGGRYRRRQHGSFRIEENTVSLAPHRAHWQPLDYNALHGGIERWFDPLPPALAQSPAFAALLCVLAERASSLRGPQTWFAEAHAFRIDTEGGIGRPTPEGAHRDGVDLVAVMLMARHNVKGGETRVFDARGPQGVRFTLTQPFSTLLLDDQRVIHETTPIQPRQPGEPTWRDTLVVTLRAGGFLDP